jgi:succinylglutamic semialdehyde dehydrogenase
MSNPGHFIANRWGEGSGDSFRRTSPTDGQTTWAGAVASPLEIDAAVKAARDAQPAWGRARVEKRIQFLQTFAGALKDRSDQLIDAICRETGKPRWEAATEVDAMVRKTPISIAAFHERRAPSQTETAGEIAATRYKPHGVVGVFGPFNLPGHLPNGHIVPALLAGNTVIFKPSEQAPLVGEITARAWEAAGLPPGVFNLVQGGRDAGIALSSHDGLDGLYFTGSFPVGKSLSQARAPHPGKILALEMGGNNPMIVWEAADLDAAVYLIVVSAFITSGQRCSCARRLIIPDSSAGATLIEKLIAATSAVRVDRYDAQPEPFMGTVISPSAAAHILTAQAKLIGAGASPLLPSRTVNDNAAMLSPGILDVTSMRDRPDDEIFGPLLQVIRVSDFDAAVREANRTRYGLSAGLLSDSPALFEHFYDTVRAGLINWNRPLTGASSALPFGGVGCSGNHRPSGSWAADYCSYPVASLEARELKMPAKKMPGL